MAASRRLQSLELIVCDTLLPLPSPQQTSSRPTSPLRTVCLPRPHHPHTNRRWTSLPECTTIIIIRRFTISDRLAPTLIHTYSTTRLINYLLLTHQIDIICSVEAAPCPMAVRRYNAVSAATRRPLDSMESDDPLDSTRTRPDIS